MIFFFIWGSVLFVIVLSRSSYVRDKDVDGYTRVGGNSIYACVKRRLRVAFPSELSRSLLLSSVDDDNVSS